VLTITVKKEYEDEDDGGGSSGSSSGGKNYATITPKDSSSSGSSTGSSFVSGLVNALTSTTTGKVISTAASAVGSVLSGAVNKALGIHSPSTVAFESGGYYIEGLVNALYHYTSMVKSASEYVAEEMILGLTDPISRIAEFVSGDMDITPTIAPVLDLSNVENGVSRMNGMFSASRSMALAESNSASINSAMAARLAAMEAKAAKREPTNITFEQNNYSPKALSRIDIYRQTKNQFSAAKEGLNSL